MRILVLNSAVSGVSQSSGETWRYLETKYVGNVPYAATTHISLDDDVFILDPDRGEDAANLDKVEASGVPLRNVGVDMEERLHAGGVVLCFAGQRNPNWLTPAYQYRVMSGNEIEVTGDDALSEVLRKHLRQTSYRVQFELEPNWSFVAAGKNGRPVAGLARAGQGSIVLLPQFRNAAPVVRDILDRVVPELAPALVTKAAEPNEVERPDWLARFTVAKADALAAQIAELDSKIEELRIAREAKHAEREELDGYRGLLWLDGRPLEAIVLRALNLLGIAAHAGPAGRVDLVCPRPDGGELFIEVEGTTGPVQVEKGSQLLRYLGDTDDPSVVYGAIVGNAFRKLAPDQRPPTGSTVGEFSGPLEKLAERNSWRLVRTRDLFVWVQRFLEGDEAAAAEARAALGL